MDQMAEDQLDFEDEEYGGGSQKLQYQGSGGAISALADEEPMIEDDDYDDLYNDVNVGEGFMQMHRSEPPVPPSGNGLQFQKIGFPDRRDEIGASQEMSIPGVSPERKHANIGSHLSGQKEGISVDKKPEPGSLDRDNQTRQMGFQGSTSVQPEFPKKITEEPVQQISSIPRGGAQIISTQSLNVHHQAMNENQIRPQVENGSTMLFVGELHWWTTDAEIETVLSQYGTVKEVKFFDERASGKSKGYCQVEFFDAGAATSCKAGMHGHVFNGRACVVAFASPQTLKQMGAAYANKNPAQNQSQQPQGRRPGNDGVGRGGNQNFDGGRGFGRGGGWGRGGQGALNNRNPGNGGPVRGRGGAMSVKNNMVGAGYGQGIPGPAFGGPAMMGSGFDPAFMGRGGGYGGFPGPGFPGMMPSFPGVNPMVAPHVNPAFFGRGMGGNMGMMGNSLMEGQHGGMWADPAMAGGWTGEEHGRRTRESSYGGDDGASEYGYGDTNHVKREREFSGNSERRHYEEKEQDYDRPEKDQRDHNTYREEKDGSRDHHRQKDRDYDYDRDRDRDRDRERDRGQSSSRARSRNRAVQEDHHRSRSRDVDYGKRRRLPSE